ncbi:MAG: NAD(P)/FAD-dependent oxidoreductase [Candidatus Sifarchaeia archaeon]|jgi:sarcosine oxidase subunit beta
MEFDVIIIGAGSVGTPTAMALGEIGGFKVAVIEKNAEVGQGQNNRALGGVRATHTNFSKIITCLKSIEIFSNWEKKHGDDIGWSKEGYSFLAYSKEHEELLKRSIDIQKSLELTNDWMNADQISDLIPGIVQTGLRGGSYSPDDGRASPPLAINAFYKYAMSLDVEFKFKEIVNDLSIKDNKIKGVLTNKNEYATTWVINAAGISASKIGTLVGLDLPVYPELHKAGITESVISSEHFTKPLIVDLRSVPDCNNFYFFQNQEDKIAFTISPTHRIPGYGDVAPIFAERMEMLIPSLKSLKIPRKWAGAYPMTPDGTPIVGTVDSVDSIEGYINTVGMCGQGFMSGPGIGQLISRIITNKLTEADKEVLEGFSLNRSFEEPEILQ